MNTYNKIIKTSIVLMISISIMLVSSIVAAQEQTPEPPPTEAPVTEPVVTEVAPVEVVPTEAAPVVEPVVVVTEVAPVVVTEAAPVVAAPASLDVSGVRAYFVANGAAPVVGSPFALDLMVMNPSAVGISSLSLQCTLDQVLFMVDPIMSAPVQPVDGQPVPTPEPGIFGVNPYVLPLTVDSYTNTASLTIASTTGVPAFASGKAESFNLRATAAGTFNLNCTATVVDANGLTQAVATFPLSLSIQPAPVVEAPAVVEPAPVVEAPVVEAPAVEAPVVSAPAETAPVEAAPVVVEPVVPTTGTIAGQVVAGAAVTITLTSDAGVVTIVPANADGTFSIADVPAGIYTISADARAYLPAQGVVGVMPGNVVTMSTVTLVGGDLNDDNLAIDANDSILLTNTYGMSAATLPPELDLDHNGRIGLGDLNALAANLGRVGPTLWQ